MKVSELREAIAELPADREVLVSAYEEGLAEPTLSHMRVIHRPGGGWWTGDWDEATGVDGLGDLAVVLER